MKAEIAEAYYNRGLAKSDSGDISRGCKDWRRAGELGLEQAWELIKEYCQ